MRTTAAKLILALFFGVCLVLVGCEGGGSGSEDSSNGQSAVSVVGTWSGPFSIGPVNPQTTQGTIVFHADGTLTMTPTDGGDGGGTYAVSGSTVSGVARVSEAPIHFTGQLSGNTIEGTWYDVVDDNNHFRITRSS